MTDRNKIYYNDRRRELWVEGQEPAVLRAKSFAVFTKLVEAYPKPVSKRELVKEVWGDKIVSDDSITQAIADVRRALGDKDHSLLHTNPGQGYVLMVPALLEKPKPLNIDLDAVQRENNPSGLESSLTAPYTQTTKAPGTPASAASSSRTSTDIETTQNPLATVADLEHTVPTSVPSTTAPAKAVYYITQNRAFLILFLVVSAALALSINLLWPIFFSQENDIPAIFGPKLALVKDSDHKRILGDTRIDLRDIGNGEPVTIRIFADGRLELEAVQVASQRQKLQHDVGTWRSRNHQFCMTFGWYFGGTEFCAWIAKEGITYSAIYPKNERTLNWVFREGSVARSKRLKPNASLAGKILAGSDIQGIMRNTELHLGYRGQPVRIQLRSGGQLDLESLTWTGPNGRQYETDHGNWHVKEDKLCLKSGWWQDGLESCYSIRAGAFAYTLIDESDRPTPIFVMK